MFCRLKASREKKASLVPLKKAVNIDIFETFEHVKGCHEPYFTCKISFCTQNGARDLYSFALADGLKCRKNLPRRRTYADSISALPPQLAGLIIQIRRAYIMFIFAVNLNSFTEPANCTKDIGLTVRNRLQKAALVLANKVFVSADCFSAGYRTIFLSRFVLDKSKSAIILCPSGVGCAQSLSPFSKNPGSSKE